MPAATAAIRRPAASKHTAQRWHSAGRKQPRASVVQAVSASVPLLHVNRPTVRQRLQEVAPCDIPKSVSPWSIWWSGAASPHPSQASTKPPLTLESLHQPELCVFYATVRTQAQLGVTIGAGCPHLTSTCVFGCVRGTTQEHDVHK
jgi:hypothetical protein